MALGAGSRWACSGVASRRRSPKREMEESLRRKEWRLRERYIITCDGELKGNRESKWVELRGALTWVRTRSSNLVAEPAVQQK